MRRYREAHDLVVWRLESRLLLFGVLTECFQAPKVGPFMRLQTLLEARWILAVLAHVAVAATFFSVWLSLFCLLIFFSTVSPFRDPERIVPPHPNSILAAADWI